MNKSPLSPTLSSRVAGGEGEAHPATDRLLSRSSLPPSSAAKTDTRDRAQSKTLARSLGWASLALLIFGLCQRPALAANPPGLYVQDGILKKDGLPYLGIGANYFSLFSRLLDHPQDPSSFTNLAALAHARIPFVRFMCGGFWPSEQRLYLTNREAFLQRLDRVVRCAETNGVGLIPSLFWFLPTVPDLVGESVDQYGNPESKTLGLLRRYTEDLVQRYKDSPALWGWEFGNEYNLDCDLPNAAEHRPPVVPGLGTAPRRTERDELKFTQLRSAFAAFAETARRFDSTRIIVSGNAIPRASAWHNVREKKWTADTAAQFGEMLIRDNPDPMNLLTIHLYPETGGRYSGGAATLGATLGLASQYATQSGKPLFLGEFGVPHKLGTRPQQQAVFQELLDGIVKHRVPLSAFWVFDFGGQDKDWNVSFQNDRAWMIALVTKANERLRER